MEVVASIIQQLGFPIACVLFLGLYVKKLTDQYREDIQSLTAKYDQAIAMMQEKYDKAIDKFVKSNDRISAILSTLEAKLENRKEGEA